MDANAPIGNPVDRRAKDWFGVRHALVGRSVCVAPIDRGVHGADLWNSFASSDRDGRLWTYMGYGPFASREEFDAWLKAREASADPLFYAIVSKTSGQAAGMASFMRMNPQDGVVEIGNIWFSPALQRTRAATEALFLMMRYAMEELGCRRLEWKCNALNEASRRAALRLGFAYEGTFRNHMIVKGRNRDTAWFAITEEEWPALREAFDVWLADENFDESGRQKSRLDALTASARQSCCA